MEPSRVVPLRTDDEVEVVCASGPFRKAPAQRELLRYLWQRRHESTSEYAIGVEALGRKSDFDPKFDSTVRVQVSRLRQRLKDYYETEGAHLARRIQIPLGEYRAEVVEVAPSVQPAPPPTLPVPPARPRWPVVALAAVAVLLVADNVRLRATAPRPPDLPAFWSSLAAPGGNLPIIIPAPVFFRWEGQPYVVRDFGANQSTDFKDSPFLAPLAKQLGPPQMSQLYTVASDTRAASQLSHYLQDRGITTEVTDTPAATVELLGSQKAIVFAGPGTTSQLGGLVEGMNFYILPGKGGVLNRAPKPGEPAHFTEVRHAPLRSTNYGIIARLPGRAPGATALVFLSTYNPALLAVCIRPPQLAQLESSVRMAGSPPFFESVVRFERNADLILEARVVTTRPISR